MPEKKLTASVVISSAARGILSEQNCAQAGEPLEFYLNVPKHYAKHVTWCFGDNQQLVGVKVTRKFFNDSCDEYVGEMHVCAEAILDNGCCAQAKACFFIAPKLHCVLCFDDTQNFGINCDTEFVEVSGAAHCNAVEIENIPTKLLKCNGCDNVNRELKAIFAPLRQNLLFQYGQHNIVAKPRLYTMPCDNCECEAVHSTCAIEKCDYQPVSAVYNFLPTDACIDVKLAANPCHKWQKKITLLNFSDKLLPRGAYVQWRIFTEKRVHWCENNRCKSLCYEFRQPGYYCIEATIFISQCLPPIRLRSFLRLHNFCSADVSETDSAEENLKQDYLFTPSKNNAVQCVC